MSKAPEPTAAEKAIVPLDKLRTMLDGPALVEIKKALPPAMKGNERRIARTLVTALQGNPYLQTCTGLSLVGAAIQTAQLGLEVGGPLGQAYIVPYWSTKHGANLAQVQVGYRGLLNLAHRSGQVKALFAHPVHRADAFRFQLGSNPKVVHTPADGDRGEVTHYYAVLRTITGGVDIEVATVADIKAHRQKYVKPPKFGTSPWDTNFDQMACKTLLRKIAKRCPISIDFQKAAVLDEYGEQEVEQGMTQIGAEAMARVDLEKAAVQNGVTATADGQVIEGEVIPFDDGGGDDGDPENDRR